MDFKTKIELCIKDCMDNHNKSVEEIFEIFNLSLNKIAKKKNKKPNKKRNIVCRPVMMISDSSDDNL